MRSLHKGRWKDAKWKKEKEGDKMTGRKGERKVGRP